MNLWEQAQTDDNTPLTHPWGYFTRSDVPAPMGGGSLGTFVWRSSREELLTVLEQELSEHWFHPIKPLTRPETLAAVVSLLSRLRSGASEAQGVVDEINDKTRGVVLLEWLGEFSDLCGGSSDFGLDLRKQYWERYGDGVLRPIPKSEEAAFSEFLADWGL